MKQPCFRNNWKAISPCFYLIKRIAALNNMKHGEAVEFYSGEIASIFRPYTNGSYAEYLNALEVLRLLEIDHAYEFTANRSGHCKKYRVTDFGCRLIHSSNMEYLKKLNNNPDVIRRNQKSISNRKVMAKSYDNPVLDYIYDGLKNISFDYDHIEQAIRKSHWSDVQKASVSSGLCCFRKKSFEELEIGGDGRIHHEFVLLKSDARVLLKYKQVPYKAVLDIRCCHPTFFSSYVISLPYTLHYVRYKTDKWVNLELEHRKWVSLFCDPSIDPKEIIREACGFEDTETAKAALNQSLNGSKAFPKFLTWIKKEYPIIFDLWQQTDVKTTGSNISKIYERKLILHQGLFDHATQLGIEKIMPEHDGLGVFAKDDDQELRSKLKALADYLQAYSVRQFGVPVIIKTKMVLDWTNTDLHQEMGHNLSMLGKEYCEVKPREGQMQRKYYAGKRGSSDWQQYEEQRKKEHALLLRYEDVLEYWDERERRGLN